MYFNHSNNIFEYIYIILIIIVEHTVVFPGSSARRESAYNAGETALILGSRRSTGEGIDYPL